MKRIIISSLFLVLLFSGYSSKITFPDLSEKIYQKYGGIHDRSTFKVGNSQREARLKAFLKDTTAFLKGELKDTIFILEQYNIESSMVNGRIWNNVGSINYSYLRHSLSLQKTPNFTNYQIKLVRNWNIKEIRKEEKLNGNWLDNYSIINAIRCFPKKGNWQMEVISFKDFFDPKRDMLITQ